MSPLLAPILAQVVTLQLGDRTEARYTDAVGDSPTPAVASGSTAPNIALRVNNRRSSVQLNYVPSLTLSPLNRSPRELYVFHTAGANFGYRWRRTTAQIGNSVSIGSLSLRLASVQGPQTTTGQSGTNQPASGDNSSMGGGSSPTMGNGSPTTGSGSPTTGGGTPTTGGTPVTPGGVVTRLADTDQKVAFYTSTTTIGVSHDLTKRVRFGVSAGTTISGGLNDVSRQYYKPLRGYFIGGNTGYAFVLSRRDAFLTSVSLTKTWSSNDNQVANGSITESWGHIFNKETSGGLGAGLNVTRFTQADGLAGFSIFPTFQLGIVYRTQLGRGRLSLAVSAYGSPALDPLRALVDPRVGVGGSVGYSRNKLFWVTSGSAALSLAPKDRNAGAVNATAGETRLGYQIGQWVAVDGGARLAYQSYEGQTVISTTWAAFAGVTLGYRVTLLGNH
jgi:hypothetical protein